MYHVQIDGSSSPLACPLVQYPPSAYMVNESMPWHNQVKEEKCLDNEMALQLSLFISFSSVFQLLITSNAMASSPPLTRDWL